MTRLAEKYGRAIRSSHLQCNDQPGDIDTVIAAGGVRDGIGTDMLRLRSQRDSISGMPGETHLRHALKSMASARNRLIRYTAERTAHAEDSLRLRAVVAGVLDLFLSPNCEPCNGVGTIGGYGTPQNVCPTCSGSRLRQLYWDEESAGLAVWIEARMLEKMHVAERLIARALRETG